MVDSTQINRILKVFEAKESEETWSQHLEALQQIKQIAEKTSPNQLDLLIQCVKQVKDCILQSMASDRTKLSGSACEVVAVLAKQLSTDFECVSDAFLASLLKLCARANRIIAQRATLAILEIVKQTASTRPLVRLESASKNANKVARLVAAQALKQMLEHRSTEDLKNVCDGVETVLRNGLMDAESSVREISRATYQLYRFEANLPPTTVKYLHIPGTQQPILKSPKQPQQKIEAVPRTQSAPAPVAVMKLPVSAAQTPSRVVRCQVTELHNTKQAEATFRLGGAQGLGRAQRIISHKEEQQQQPNAGSLRLFANTKMTTPEKQARPAPVRLMHEPIPVETKGAETVVSHESLSVDEQVLGDEIKVAHSHLPKSSKVPEDVLVEEKIEADANKFIEQLCHSFAKSSEWSIRSHAIEKMKGVFGSATLETETLQLVYRSLMTALSDTHFRIVKAALEVLNDEEVAKQLEKMKLPDRCIPFLMNILEDPQYRNKSFIMNPAKQLFERLQPKIQEEGGVHYLVNILNNNDYNRNVRIRHGAIKLIPEYMPKSVAFFTKVSAYRTFLSRLASSLTEHDRPVASHIKESILKSHKMNVNLFFEALAYLSAPEREKIKKTCGKVIKDYAKHEEAAMSHRKSSRMKDNYVRPTKIPAPSQRKMENVPKLEQKISASNVELNETGDEHAEQGVIVAVKPEEDKKLEGPIIAATIEKEIESEQQLSFNGESTAEEQAECVEVISVNDSNTLVEESQQALNALGSIDEQTSADKFQVVAQASFLKDADMQEEEVVKPQVVENNVHDQQEDVCTPIPTIIITAAEEDAQMEEQLSLNEKQDHLLSVENLTKKGIFPHEIESQRAREVAEVIVDNIVVDAVSTIRESSEPTPYFVAQLVLDDLITDAVGQLSIKNAEEEKKISQTVELECALENLLKQDGTINLHSLQRWMFENGSLCKGRLNEISAFITSHMPTDDMERLLVVLMDMLEIQAIEVPLFKMNPLLLYLLTGSDEVKPFLNIICRVAPLAELFSFLSDSIPLHVNQFPVLLLLLELLRSTIFKSLAECNIPERDMQPLLMTLFELISVNYLQVSMLARDNIVVLARLLKHNPAFMESLKVLINDMTSAKSFILKRMLQDRLSSI